MLFIGNGNAKKLTDSTENVMLLLKKYKNFMRGY